MTRNTLTPEALAKELIAHSRSQVRSAIQICQTFAKGWNAYVNGEWDNDQISRFLISVHEAGIGPDPSQSILKENNEGRFKIPTTGTSFFLMKAVGEHPMFEDKDIVEACKVSGYSVLYALVSHYEALLGKNANHERAKRETLKLLAIGSELRRDDVRAAIDKLKRKSVAPKEPKGSTPDAPQGSRKALSSLRELVAEQVRFETVLITPPDEVLDEISNSSLDTLYERYSIADVSDEKSEVHIVANGAKLSAALRLANVLGVSSPHIYGIAKRDSSARVFELSAMEVLISSAKVEQPSKSASAKGALDLVHDMVSAGDRSQLHLFADQEREGWTACLGTEDSLAVG